MFWQFLKWMKQENFPKVGASYWAWRSIGNLNIFLWSSSFSHPQHSTSLRIRRKNQQTSPFFINLFSMSGWIHRDWARSQGSPVLVYQAPVTLPLSNSSQCTCLLLRLHPKFDHCYCFSFQNSHCARHFHKSYNWCLWLLLSLGCDLTFSFSLTSLSSSSLILSFLWYMSIIELTLMKTKHLGKFYHVIDDWVMYHSQFSSSLHSCFSCFLYSFLPSLNNLLLLLAQTHFLGNRCRKEKPSPQELYQGQSSTKASWATPTMSTLMVKQDHLVALES